MAPWQLEVIKVNAILFVSLINLIVYSLLLHDVGQSVPDWEVIGVTGILLTSPKTQQCQLDSPFLLEITRVHPPHTSGSSEMMMEELRG